MTALIGQSLGRYHILEQLGEGGMAIVYKAYDTRLERNVAIKIIRRGSFPPDQLDRILTRFEREAKALARLSHPNIIKVIDYGDHEGSPYLVMEFLPAGTLKHRLGKPIPWMEAVKLLLPVAQALEYAHEHNIIHRDIKPSNILLMEKGQPMLTDFGIAKILESEETATLTGTGIGVGTPEYMAPEQWTGSATAQSDIYSLGVVLYELVTGRKPYEADTPAAILLKQATDPLPRPRQLVRDLPEAVEKVLVKALATNPEDRYREMDGLIGALNGLLERKITPARNEQAARPAEKQKSIAAPRKAFLTPVILVAGVVLLGIFYLARRSAFQTPAVLKAAESPVASTVIPVDLPLVATQNPTVTSTVTSTPIPTDTPAGETRVITWNATSIPWPATPITSANASHIQELLHQKLGTGWSPIGLAIAPDGSSFYYGFGNFVYRLRVADGSMQTITDDQYHRVGCIQLSPDGSRFTAVSGNNFDLRRVADGALISRVSDQYANFSCYLAFSPDGGRLAYWVEKAIIISNTEDASVALQISSPDESDFRGMAFSPDGSLLALGSTGNRVFVWDSTNGALLRTLQGEEYDFGNVAFSPDGTLLASSAFDGTIWVWRVADWSLAYRSESIAASDWGWDYNRLVFSQKGDLMASLSSRDETTALNLWDTATGTRLANIALGDGVWGLGFAPDDSFLFIGLDGTNRYTHDSPFLSLWGIAP